MSKTLCLAMMGHYKCTNQSLALKLQVSFSFLLQGMWNIGQIVEAAEPTANGLAVKTSLAVWWYQRGPWAQPQVGFQWEGLKEHRVRGEGRESSARKNGKRKGCCPPWIKGSPSSCSQEHPYILSSTHRGHRNIRPVLKGSMWLSTKKFFFLGGKF